MKYKQLFHSILRVIVALVLIGLLAASIDRHRLLELLRHIDYTWLGSAFLSLAFVRFLMSVRWQYILNIHGINPSFMQTMRITFICTALGSVLPGGLGPDIIRTYQMSHQHGNLTSVSSSIIIDRVIGLYSMLFLAFIAAVIVQLMGKFSAPVWTLFILQIGFIGTWFTSFLLRNTLAKTPKFLSLINQNAFIERLWDFFSLITNIQIIKKIFVVAFFLSLTVQLARCLMFFCLYHALGASLDLITSFIFIPLVFAIMFVPISIGGLGVREAALIFFGEQYGISTAISFSAGILSHAFQLLLPVVAIVFWYLEKVQRKKDHIEDHHCEVNQTD